MHAVRAACFCFSVSTRLWYHIFALIFLQAVSMLLSAHVADGGAIISFTPGAVNPSVAGNPVIAPSKTVTVRPVEISDVLYNPGMGFADFQFGWGSGKPLPTPEEYPPQTIAYFRTVLGD